MTTSALLAGVLLWEHEQERARWNAIPMPDAAAGARLFHEKGCSECHRVGGDGQRIGPDLCSANLDQSAAFVAAFWNAAPHMWALLDWDQDRTPTLGRQELGHLYAFFREVRFSNPRGDADRGRGVFASKGCGECHEPASLEEGIADRRPLAFARSLAAHPSTAEAVPQAASFSGDEMSDLIAYLRSDLPAPRHRPTGVVGDAIRGSQVFRRPTCSGCHLEGEEVVPGLLLDDSSGTSLGDVSGSMWNHAMRAEQPLEARDLSEQDLADLVAFLDNTRHAEPGGSSRLGELVFRLRGCAGCHGAGGEGSESGPAVRGHNRPGTTIELAAELWRHGPEMARRLRAEHGSWPTLTADDVGNLLAFFNSPPNELP